MDHTVDLSCIILLKKLEIDKIYNSYYLQGTRLIIFIALDKIISIPTPVIQKPPQILLTWLQLNPLLDFKILTEL